MRRLPVLLLLPLFFQSLVAAQVIESLAGNGLVTFCGDGGPAELACVNQPRGMALDFPGNLYFADKFNHRVRVVDAVTGLISTYAGNGTGDFCGDYGPATEACLAQPTGIAFDRFGNLYIAERYNNRVRRVDGVTKIITTVAGDGTYGASGDGGPAIRAQLAGPQDVAFTPDGHLLISDTDNSRIRIVDVNGIIDTYAGTGIWSCADPSGVGDEGPATAACLKLPGGIAVDAEGNLFIADDWHDRVRRVDFTTKVITTVAGNGTMGFCGDGGLGAQACLACPQDVTLDDNGNLYIADGCNGRVRMVDSSTARITTLAGSGDPGFCGERGGEDKICLAIPRGIEMDSHRGVLYISAQPDSVYDDRNHRVWRDDLSSPYACSKIQCSGEHWIALPTTSDIKTAEELLQSIPNAIRVHQVFPEGAGRYTYGYQGPIGGPPPAYCISGSPEPGSCVSSCFCIDDGEGFIVDVTGPMQFDINGIDDPADVTLPLSGQQYLVSPPFRSEIVTAKEFLLAIGAPVGTTVIDRDGCTETLRTYVLGQYISFDLVPGRAVAVSLPGPSGLTYTNPVNPSAPPPQPCTTSYEFFSERGIPTLSTWGIVALFTLLMFSGLWILHRARHDLP